MNGLNSSADEVVECPLCMEPLEVDDLHFYPCTCGYQICRFCWHRIRTDENELCPACRKEYPENPADFTPLTQEEVIAFKSQKKQRDQQRKQKITENRKHLINVRVVQKNLVFVVGLPPRLADADVLKKHEYFGKYGKIHKVVINPSTTYAGVQGPSASAYVTYVHSSDALRAIQSVNNILIDGRLIKTSLGTTKYCSHFMKNQQCPKSDCMYLHELGDPEASFTKEEMHQGKHQEYEKRLHDALIVTSGGNGTAQVSSTGAIVGPISVIGSNNVIGSTNVSIPHQTNKTAEGKALDISLLGPVILSVSPHTAKASTTNVQPKEAWPSLSVSPIKEISTGNNTKTKKDKLKNERGKNDKTTKVRNKNNNHAPSLTISNLTNRENTAYLHPNDTKTNMSSLKSRTENVDILVVNYNKPKNKEKMPVEKSTIELNQQQKVEKKMINVDEEVKLIEDTEYKNRCNECPNIKNAAQCDNTILQNVENRSQSSNSNISITSNISDSVSTFSDSSNGSGKSSPGNILTTRTKEEKKSGKINLIKKEHFDNNFIVNKQNQESIASSSTNTHNDMANTDTKSNFSIQDTTPHHTDNNAQLSEYSHVAETKGAFSKLHLFDDNNSFFSTSLQKSPFLKHKPDDQSNVTIVGQSQLPDLLNGIDGYVNNGYLNDNNQNISNYVNDFNTNAFPSQLLEESTTHQRQSETAPSSSNTLFGTNMTKFFDFHKIQQQQQLQQSLAMTTHTVKNPLVLATLFENNRINSQIGEQANGYITQHPEQQQQQQLHKQRIYSRLDTTLPSLSQQSLQLDDSQPNHISRPLPLTIAAEDDLGFDPFIETQKGLAELMENEMIQQNAVNSPNTTGTKINQHQLLDTQRTRMPPPGFNHMSAFGVGLPRVQNNGNILPVIEIIGNASSKNRPHASQQQQVLSTWNPHFAPFEQRSLINQHMQQVNQPHNYNSSNYKGYRSDDWTAMDPAILSFRQFTSYPQQPQTLHRPHEDFFLHQLSHQQLQNMPGLTSQAHLQSNMNMPNILNTQQASSAQVNTNVQGMLEFLKTRQFV